MKNPSDDPLDNLFQSHFEKYEKKAPTEPLKGVLSKLSAQKTIGYLLIGMTIFLLVGLITLFNPFISTQAPISKNSQAIPQDKKQLSNTSQNISILKSIDKDSYETTSIRANDSNLSSNNLNDQSTKNESDQNFHLLKDSQQQEIVQKQLIDFSNKTFIIGPLVAKNIPRKIKNIKTPDLVKIEIESTEEFIPRNSKKISRSTIYAQAMPMLLYNVITPNKYDELLIRNFETQNTLSAQRLGLRASLNYEYALSKRIRVVTGVSLFYKKLSFSYSTINYEIDSTVTVTHIPGVGIEIKTQSLDTINNDNQISITSKNIGFFGGVLYAINEQHQIGVNFELQKHLNSKAANNEDQLGIVDRSFMYLYYSYEHRLSEQFILNVQPTLSYSFNKVQSNSPIAIKPYGIGLGIGIKYKLKNRLKSK